MRAATYSRYGGPLRVGEVPRPTPLSGEVLIRVRAAALNSWDWDLFVGNLLGRIAAPFRPAHRILGADVAGVVESVGPDVDAFAVGDAVAGDLSDDGWGTLAEFVVAPVKALARIPDGVGFEQAAALPQAGSLALQALRKRRPVAAGESVLINGAGGGVGTFAIQLAKQMGAEVTAVDSAAKLELMRGLGADHVIDYAREDFVAGGRRYDRIIDPVAARPMAAYRKCLADAGTLVVIGGRLVPLLQLGLIGPMTAKADGQDIGLLLWQTGAADTAELLALCADGTLSAAIDRICPLDETEQALRELGAGKVLGKVIVRPDA